MIKKNLKEELNKLSKEQLVELSEGLINDIEELYENIVRIEKETEHCQPMTKEELDELLGKNKH